MADSNEALLNALDQEENTKENVVESKDEELIAIEGQEQSVIAESQKDLKILQVSTTGNFNLQENIKNLSKDDWRTKQIESALTELWTSKRGFYTINESWNVEYDMDLVKEYLNSLKDKSWTELKSKNTAALIMAVQIALESQWFDVWKIDGTFWELTKNCVLKYKESVKAQWNNILVNSRPDGELIKSLLKGMETKPSENVTETSEVKEDKEDVAVEATTSDNWDATQDNPTDVTENKTKVDEVVATNPQTEKTDSTVTSDKTEDVASESVDKKDDLLSLDRILRESFWSYNKEWEFVFHRGKIETDESNWMQYLLYYGKKVYFKTNEQWTDIGIFENWVIQWGIRYNIDGSMYKWNFKNWEFDWVWRYEQNIINQNEHRRHIVQTILVHWNRSNWELMTTWTDNSISINHKGGKAEISTPLWNAKLEVNENKLYANISYMEWLLNSYKYNIHNDNRLYDFQSNGDSLNIVEVNKDKEWQITYWKSFQIFDNVEWYFWVKAEDMAKWLTEYRTDYRDFVNKKKEEKRKAEEELRAAQQEAFYKHLDEMYK